MRKEKHLIKWLLVISVTTLIILVIIMILKVSEFQGDARVINYAGRARGATQRLIKQELTGHENDELIYKLDAILDELSTGKGDNNLKLLNDDNYRSSLQIQIVAWEKLKEAIYNTRENKEYVETLYILSEEYYALSEVTVDAAEIYSANLASMLRNLKLVIATISFIILGIILALSYNLLRLARINNNLNQVAYIDTLTKLPNRTHCEIRMREVGIINKNTQICCLMFDLNNLKTTNDDLGHKAGDNLIISFANILRSSAPDKMFIGRFGGDEFVGIITDTSENEIELFIKLLINNVDKHNNDDNTIKISFAYGYAFSSSYENISIYDLLGQADKRMYILKARMKT